MPFLHFLVYGIGKPLIEHDLLPDRLRDSADRFRGERDVFAMNADATGPVNLTEPASGGMPAWSPSGAKLAFEREDPLETEEAEPGESRETREPREARHGHASAHRALIAHTGEERDDDATGTGLRRAR